jgi:predicted transcriptional regulator
METWEQMKERHQRECYDAVNDLAKRGLTQTQAAVMLDMKLSALNNFIKRNNIHWKVIRQGKRTDEINTST